MLPVAHQGKSNESELYNSLKAHLNNKNRLQPFIGLSSIIECVNGGTAQRDAFFICEVCVCRLDKADMRNHIMGSLHRYNYIKTKHPELLSELGEGSCLSKLAWPMMDIAKRVEGNEGPGNVQVVEFDKASYLQMESQTINAENVLDFLKDTMKDTDPEIFETIPSKKNEQSRSPSQRIVLYCPQKKPETASLDLQNSPQHSNANPSSSRLLVDQSSSILNDYGGQSPLMGLVRVIECKGPDGQTHCFLCHCCRVRAHKYDIIDHLTSSSHITNYLMESHPEQLDRVDLNDSHQVFLLAENLNKEEGTDFKLKVVQLPLALCIQMTTKSYHWCVKTLGWNNSSFPVTYKDVKRHDLTKFLQQKDLMEENFQQGQKRLKTIKQKNPVFKVTLPITQGSLLIERTSFSKDSLTLTTDHLDPGLSPDSNIFPDPSYITLESPPEPFDSTSKNTVLGSQNQLNSSVDFLKSEDYPIMQELEPTDSFENRNYANKTNIDLKDGYAHEWHAATLYNAHTPTQSLGEYLPHSILWSVGTKGNESCAPTYHQQCPQYLVPGRFPQQNLYPEPVQGAWGMSLQNPLVANSFSHNNSISVPEYSQSYSSYYADHGGNAQNQYTSYQVNSSGCGTYQSQSLALTGHHSPFCVPPYPGAAFPNVNAESASSDALYYPMSNLSYSQGPPY
ncbi:unnamed protein product [Knipowitschia caucasica]